MGRKQSPWGTIQNNECVKQFNLFQTSGGEEGWNPEKHDKSYIVSKLREVAATRRFLKVSEGGTNEDNSKGLRGYRRASSEFWVLLAARGIRKSKRVLI